MLKPHRGWGGGVKGALNFLFGGGVRHRGMPKWWLKKVLVVFLLLLLLLFFFFLAKVRSKGVKLLNILKACELKVEPNVG